MLPDDACKDGAPWCGAAKRDEFEGLDVRQCAVGGAARQ